jgi:hypothetical protein
MSRAVEFLAHEALRLACAFRFEVRRRRISAAASIATAAASASI